ELLVGGLEAFRRLHRLAHRVVLAALLVAGAIDRSQHVLGELGRLLENGATQIGTELTLRRQRLQGAVGIENLVENEPHVTQGGMVLRHLSLKIYTSVIRV